MQKLFKYDENTFGVISDSAPKIGETFYTGRMLKDKKAEVKEVVSVIESRPSKGAWLGTPKTWSKVSVL